MRLLFAIIFLLFVRISGSSQDLDLIFRHFGPDDGLYQNAPYNALRDSVGYLWICGENGLWRYNGFDFKGYQVSRENPNSIPHNYIWTQFLDSRGRIWLCTYGGGLSMFDPEYETFTNYKHQVDSNSLSSNFVRGITEDPDGNYWIGSNYGLNVLRSDGSFDLILESDDGLLSNTVRKIVLSRDQSRLFICTSHGLNIYDLGSQEFTKRYTTSEFEGIANLPYAYVYTVYEDNEGSLWIGTGDGLAQVDPRTNKSTVYTTDEKDPGSISSYVIFEVIPDLDSTKLWIGTINGLNYFDKLSNKFRQAPSSPNGQNTLRGNNIYCTSIDEDGNLWIGVKDGALHQHNREFQKVRTEAFALPKMDPHLKQITAIVPHRETEMLVASYGGLWVWNRQTGERKLYKIPQITTERNRIRQVLRIDDNRYWVTTLGWFIFEWNHKQKTFTQVKSPEFSNLRFNTAIFRDSQGTIWLGNNEFGLHRWNEQTRLFEPVRLRPELEYLENDNQLVNYIYEDESGTLWVAGGDGFYKYLGNDKFQRFQHSESDPFSLPFDKVVHISEDSNGNLWLATESGLGKFDKVSETFTNFFAFNSQLPTDNITATIEDNRGSIWVSTVNGLCRLNPNTGKIIVFDTGDGLPSNQFFNAAVFKDDDGILYFGNAEGMVIVDPQSIEPFLAKKPPEVRVSALELFGVPVSATDSSMILRQSMPYTDTVSLEADQNVITLRYTAFNFVNSYKNKYQYKLEGYDQNWRPVTTERSTTYTNLNPGEYTFYVKASNDMNIWNEKGDYVHIIINPPWYGTLWFKIIIALILVSIPFVYVNLRTRQVRANNELLERMVDERTQQLNQQSENIRQTNNELQRKNQRIHMLMKELNHRVKNNLQLVSSLLNLQSHQINDASATRILTAGRLRMQAISIIHQKLTINEFSTAVSIREYIEELIDNLSLAFKTEEKDFRYNVEIDNVSIDLDQAIPIGLIINELVTNSLKYAWLDDKLAISISFFKVDDGTYTLVYQDDGPGIDEQKPRKDSLGSSLIQDLIYQLGGKTNTYYSGGLVVEITIPNINHRANYEK